MNKIGFLLLAIALTTACKTARKSADGDGSSGSGGVRSFDASPMNFSAMGSDSGKIDGLQTVFFDYDKATLTAEERGKLMANIDWMKKYPKVKMTIEGHCDFRGSNEYNLSLGERRANTVKRVLIDNGIADNRLATVSFGEEKPLVQGESEAAMSKNRRANFVPAQ
jgi:peptidoglycan-associated lipoprotein